MPTPSMIAVRPVNLRIGNLHDHMVSEIHFAGNSLVLHFGETGKTALAFSLQLEGLLGFVDRGAVLQPLTAGIVWAPPGPLGRELAARHRRDPESLIELRLDFENSSGLVSRFDAVAQSIRIV